MPARMRPARFSSLSDAGPMVAMIFVRRAMTAHATGRPVLPSSLPSRFAARRRDAGVRERPTIVPDRLRARQRSVEAGAELIASGAEAE